MIMFSMILLIVIFAILIKVIAAIFHVVFGALSWILYPILTVIGVVLLFSIIGAAALFLIPLGLMWIAFR